MNAILKILLSMSCSGSILILALLGGKRLFKDRMSRQWQYYVWLIVILRLLLPFGLEINLMGNVYQEVDLAIAQTAPVPPPVNTDSLALNNVDADSQEDALTPAHSFQEIELLFVEYVWLIWLTAALGLLLRKATIYQSFARYVRAGMTPVSDIGMLDRLSTAAERVGVKRPVELCVNPLVSSPLFLGIFHPCIVLPSVDISEKDFQYIVLHELTHCKRQDLLYKWLVQVTVCLHWFNPLVHLLSREIARDCEFSCDEAVLVKVGCGSAQEYGETLLDAMAAVGRYRENPGAVTLSENKQLLKERLGAIMGFKKKSTAIRLMTGALTLCVVAGAAFVGVYPVAEAADHTAGSAQAAVYKTPAKAKTNSGRYSRMAEKYYEADSLPLFQMAFCRLDEAAQSKWLDKIYADRRLAFLGAAVNLLDEDCAQIQHLAETIYKDGDIAYFSTLTTHMSEDALEVWLDRALEDEKWAFQSVLFNALDWDDAWDESEEKQDKEWEAAQIAEYGAVGVTMDGKNYYYQGQLVNIFLDIRSNKSFYTLNMNPKGTVNIKIIRDANNKILSVAYMTEAEVTELLGDMSDEDDDWQESVGGKVWHPQVIPVNYETMADGEIVWLGEYTLSEGDRIWYNVLAETGNGLQVGFAKAGDTDLSTTYYSVKNSRQKGGTLECTASFTFEAPVKSGTYKLFLYATDGALGKVKGSVSIGFIADAS